MLNIQVVIILMWSAKVHFKLTIMLTMLQLCELALLPVCMELKDHVYSHSLLVYRVEFQESLVMCQKEVMLYRKKSVFSRSKDDREN